MMPSSKIDPAFRVFEVEDRFLLGFIDGNQGEVLVSRHTDSIFRLSVGFKVVEVGFGIIL
jgi:hypothetical protein